ncbi:hypothetical protein MAPG_11037 [Magnaporthiopsis poae ATCC 64411]|uniref:Methyltransferase domain-containing protein n=1 Tax=Magnaporthiopsis poae (strain ATCC 64411 / 73-15) TaxID=644358 RepID=A0A0C4EE72_MAGP6|nr:hypothetical protein MAPG_11037 [Magnaporthiopsis poae ATCC 64411]
MSLNEETQPASAQRMYTARADGYDDSHHPALSRRFMAIADVRPGERVLVLCCGTGLEVILAAEAGAASVVGVDVTDAMLAKARAKLLLGDGDGLKTSSSNIRLYAGDVTRLDETVPELAGQVFDVVVCCSAFVLLAEPETVLRSWKRFLVPGGRLVVDVPHEHNLLPGLLLERAARRLSGGSVAAYPSNRTWVEDRHSFAHMLERAAGYAVEEVRVLDKVSGRGDVEYGIEQVDEQFEQAARSSITVGLPADEWVDKVRPLFREEWEKVAVDGKVVSVDAVYVYVARVA